uniref:Peptidase S1 domain-containing protein n=2 Tax=Auxenochlorella protothecoides TaxID=3075 RepID=A0A1D2AFF0_AUXPR
MTRPASRADLQRRVVAILFTLASLRYVSCQTHSFFTSPFALSVFSENRLIVGSLFSSADCNVDATCDPASLPQQLSVVQLTHPLTSNFCTGTLIKGPGDKIYILSARHCLTSFDTSFVYPWSSYGVLFNFRLPCGASRVDNITATFSDFLQGLSVVFQDVNSDVAVFELLQDIPPEWNVMLAGWDASNVLNNFTWTDVSQPFGDSQKISTGLVIGTVMSSYFNQDGYVEVSADTDCASPRCGYFNSIMYSGTLQEGASGSGLVHDDLRRVVGVLSSGAGEDCANPEDPYDAASPSMTFGRLARAWISGLYHLFDGATVEQPGGADYSTYSAPLPTLTIENIVPEVNPILGPAVISIQLQQAPQHTTTVEIASMDKTLISVSPSSVTFTASNWSTPQYVNLTAVDIIPSSESAKSFELSLTWPTVSSSGAKGSRNKTVTGIIRSDVYGTSFYNPVVVDSLPYAAEGSISSFNPQAPFITFANGPFIPGIYFSYTPPVAEGLSMVVCPVTSSLARGSLTATIYNSNWTAYQLLPQVAQPIPEVGLGCTQVVAALPGNDTYYIVAYPATSIVAPGTSHHFQGDFAVGIDALSVEKVMAAFDASSLVASINSIPYGAYATSDTTGLVFYFNPPLSTRVDITTCFNATTVATVVSLLDGETLLPISVSESEGGERCGTLLDQPVTQGQAYLILVTTPPTAVSLSRTPSVVFMSLDISAGAPGAGMEFGVVDPADSVGVGNLTIYQVGDGPAVEQLLGRSVP